MSDAYDEARPTLHGAGLMLCVQTASCRGSCLMEVELAQESLPPPCTANTDLMHSRYQLF